MHPGDTIFILAWPRGAFYAQTRSRLPALDLFIPYLTHCTFFWYILLVPLTLDQSDTPRGAHNRRPSEPSQVARLVLRPPHPDQRPTVGDHIRKRWSRAGSIACSFDARELHGGGRNTNTVGAPMSLLDRQGLALSIQVNSEGQDPWKPPLESAVLMSSHQGNNGSSRISFPSGLDPHDDARAIVRLIQCQQCSLPLRQPMTLPCGNSLCQPCLPELHKRENITYPMLPGRQEGFICPFEGCHLEHALGDCNRDVTLAKILDKVGIEVAKHRPLNSDTPMLLDERLRWRNVIDSSQLIDFSHHRMLHGGRLLATFTMAELGELRYDSEVAYQTMSPTGDSYQGLDLAFLDHLKEVIRNEMDCQVCYALMLDPLTTPCGHTFCRRCVARALDHSATCPVCRRDLHISAGTSSESSNKRLSKLLLTLCPEHVAARAELVDAEEAACSDGVRIPLFVCTLSYPGMPMFLHIFEPRYRLMIRRAMESGNRKFGMVLYNGRNEPQGELGNTQFMQFGILLHIEHMQLLPDGRSIIETRGVSRLRVVEHGMLDGYVVGRTERIDDISHAEEEALEASEVSTVVSLGIEGHNPTPLFSSLSTVELLRIGTDFIARMRATSAPWLDSNLVDSYGPMPDDPAQFPYWFASVLPIDEREKYRLLPTRSVRERLKITAGWVRRVERMRW